MVNLKSQSYTLITQAILPCCWHTPKAMVTCVERWSVDYLCHNYQLWRQVKRGAILGTMNKANENIFNCPVATKQLLFRWQFCKLQNIHSTNKIQVTWFAVSRATVGWRWCLWRMPGIKVWCCWDLLDVMFRVLDEMWTQGQVWSDYKKTSLPPLRTPSLFQVQRQRDADN